MHKPDQFTAATKQMGRIVQMPAPPIHAGAKQTIARQTDRLKQQPLTIGLVNNMPDAAFRATERQFTSLLHTAANGIPLRVVLYTLPEIEREGACWRYAQSHYRSIEELWNTPVDGLIVTGREPKTASLKQEPYWGSLTELIEWAQQNTYSTVWSCLAAHAALLHMDGIERRRNNSKHFGVIECERMVTHALTAGLPQIFDVPHSRWNGIEEHQILARGYKVLSRSASAGLDMFVKQHDSLFVFLQGHPEYSADSLLREYRREVKRYLHGESEVFPSVPSRYFDAETAAGLNAIQEDVARERHIALNQRIQMLLDKAAVENHWHKTTVRIYRNWVNYILARRNAAMADDYEQRACVASY